MTTVLNTHEQTWSRAEQAEHDTEESKQKISRLTKKNPMTAEENTNVMKCSLGYLLYLRAFLCLTAVLNRPHYEAIVSA